MRATFTINSHPNLMPYHSCSLRSNCVLIMRQYICFNLRERMIMKLEMMEKKWIAFQLICAVSQLHAEAFTHGDLKPENILLTSYNWLFITDFLTVENVYSVSQKDEQEDRMVNYKPTYVEEESWNLYNMFFGELDNNKRCYIAPERCLSRREYYQKTINNYLVQPSMDIFSVGCIIAEIFLDGKPLFDLARHQLYRKDKFNPRDMLRLIGDDDIEDLIMEMIALDPQQRQSIDVYRTKWIQKVFPPSFSTLFFQLGAVIQRDNLLFSDERISMCRKYIDAAWLTCFGEEIGAQDLITPINSDIFEYLRFENFPNIITDLFPDFDCCISHKNNGERTIRLIEFKNEKEKQNANDSALVLVILIGTLIPTCRYPDSKIMALEMLRCIGKNLREDLRLQYIVPYCIQCFNDPIIKVRVTAIDSLIEVLKDAESIEIAHTDYYVFDTYIYPAFYKLLEDPDPVIQLKFIESIPFLVNIGKMLIASVNMHRQKITMLAKQEQFEVEVDQNQREETLFSYFSGDEILTESHRQYRMVKIKMIKEEPSETSSNFAETEDESALKTEPITEEEEEEVIVTTKVEAELQLKAEKEIQSFAQTILGESEIPIPWSRRRFATEEQKVRSIVGIGYNMELNESDYELADDPEQENDIERDLELLKEKILEVVDKVIVEQDTKKNVVLMNNIEDIADFLGENINSERLLAYILSFPNLKDDMLTIATLRGLRVFSHHVSGLDEIKYIITSCDNLFYDLNEIIVLEAIKTVHYIAVQHESVFECNERCVSIIKKLILFCLHPNNQIKEYSIKTICELIKQKDISYVCRYIYPEIKRHLKFPDLKKLHLEDEFRKYIEYQVSRFAFDLAINKFYCTSNNKNVTLSLQDRSAL